MAITISVRAESRSAKASNAYDQDKHAYNPNYINPQTRRIILRSSKLPKDANAWEWLVTRRSDGRVFHKEGVFLTGLVPSKAEIGFNLPSEGVYDCQLTLKVSNGKQQKSPVTSINLRDLLVVVIGDSAASGQGNPDKPGKLNVPSGGIFDAIKDFFSKHAVEHLTSLIAGEKIDPPKMDEEPKWLEKNAHRSLRSGHARAAKMLEDHKAGTVVTLLNFARSGAEIKHGLLAPREDEVRGKNETSWIKGTGKIGQLAELTKTVGKQRIDALIISIGGNDLGFAGGVKSMTMDSEFGLDFFGFYVINHDDNKARKEIKEKVNTLIGSDLKSGVLTKKGGHFDQLKAQIDKLNIANVFLVGYPEGFFDMEDGNVGPGCEIFDSVADLDLTLADTRLFKEIAQKLNQTLRTVIAPRYGWHYVDVTAGFVGHGYCSKGGRFFVHCEESLENQGDTDGMLHPNAAGHKIYMDHVHKALHKQLIINKSSTEQPGKFILADGSTKVGGSIGTNTKFQPVPVNPTHGTDKD
jgi:lysophospholipase L1-like esterase